MIQATSIEQLFFWFTIGLGAVITTAHLAWRVWRELSLERRKTE